MSGRIFLSAPNVLGIMHRLCEFTERVVTCVSGCRDPVSFAGAFFPIAGVPQLRGMNRLV